MKCSEVKSNLPLYPDDVLSNEERFALDAHLDICPLCRQDLADHQSLRNELRGLSRPILSAGKLASLRTALASELRPSFAGPAFHLLETRRDWLGTWFVPSTIGTFASVIFGTFLLWGILFTAPDPSLFVAATKDDPKASIMLAGNNTMLGPDALDLSPSEYAFSRHAIAGESPSINPQGALVALTRSLVRGKMEDEEVVVVADVFGNGLAKIAQVVEPSDDDRSIRQLQRALESDPVYAPFVPASYDQRSETMRVVLKIQNVNVKTGLDSPKRSLPERRRS